MDPEFPDETQQKSPVVVPVIAAVVALFGLADSVYLTVHHYTAEPVPCSLVEGCEMVLTSQWAEIGGIPLAAFGAAAYFVAFSLAVLTAFGESRTWKFFGVQATLMAAFSLWLVYVQAFIIKAFCQFCLLSALSSLVLCILFFITLFLGTSRKGPVS